MKPLIYCIAVSWASVGGASWAQEKEAPAGIRVGLVNAGAVFTNWTTAQKMKSAMEHSLAPYKEKAERINAQVQKQGESLKNANAETKPALERSLTELKRQLEDLEFESKQNIAKKQEAQIIALYKEFDECVKQYAQSNKIHLVLGYGEQVKGDTFNFDNINRKMQGMDLGSTHPLYIDPSLDITEAISKLLNERADKKKPAGLPEKKGTEQSSHKTEPTQIALLKLGHVFSSSAKDQRRKEEMSTTAQVFQRKVDEIKKEIQSTTESLKGAAEPLKLILEKSLATSKRKKDDMEREAKETIEKMQKDFVQALFFQINDCVRRYAQANNIHLVLAYGEQLAGDPYTQNNINRKLHGMDKGSTHPLFQQIDLDITDAIIELMNKSSNDV